MSEELKLLPCPRCGKSVTAKRDRMNEYYVFCCEITADSIGAWNALPRALMWTAEPPKAEGWYWAMGKNNYNNAKIVELVTYNGTLHALVMGNPFVHPLLEFRFWSDCPILTPKEPTP